MYQKVQEEPNSIPERNLLVEDVCCGGFFELYLSGTVSYEEEYQWHISLLQGIREPDKDDENAHENSFMVKVIPITIKFCPMCGGEILFTEDEINPKYKGD